LGILRNLMKEHASREGERRKLSGELMELDACTVIRNTLDEKWGDLSLKTPL